MAAVDPQTVRLFAQALIAPIALLIALIALRGYIKVRSTSSLLLSASFFLLACPALLAVMELLGLFHWPTPDLEGYEYVTQTIRVLDLLALVQIAAFGLLASIYLTELKDRAVELTRLQLDALAASLAVVIVASLFLNSRYGTEFGHPVWPFVSIVLSVVLMLFVVTLMFSYYRENGNRFTLVGLTGFLLMLTCQAYDLLSYQPDVWSAVQGDSGWPAAVASLISLSGFIVFLMAIVGTRVRHA